MGARAGVASSYAGIPRRISFRGKRRFKNTSKISLIPSPSSLHNSMANMYPLPSPTGMGSDVQDKRRWSLSFSGRCENFKHNFDVSSNFGTPSVSFASKHFTFLINFFKTCVTFSPICKINSSGWRHTQ